MIKNPEISSLVPTLLMGLTDPNDHTRYSLDILLQVRTSSSECQLLWSFHLICSFNVNVFVADNFY